MDGFDLEEFTIDDDSCEEAFAIVMSRLMAAGCAIATAVHALPHAPSIVLQVSTGEQTIIEGSMLTMAHAVLGELEGVAPVIALELEAHDAEEFLRDHHGCKELSALLRRCKGTARKVSMHRLNASELWEYVGSDGGESPCSDAFSIIAHDLAAMSALRELQIYECRMRGGTPGAAAALPVLARWSQLTSLHVRHARGDKFIADTDYLRALLAGLPAVKMQHLQLECCGFQAMGQQQLHTVLQHLGRMTALTYLQMSLTQMTSELGSAVASMHQLRTLQLDDVWLTPGFAMQLAPFLAHMSALQRLDLHGRNMLHGSGVCALLQPLAEHATLTHLDVRHQLMDASMSGPEWPDPVHGLSSFATHLRRMTGLRTLRIDSSVSEPASHRTHGSVSALGDALACLVHLQALTMSQVGCNATDMCVLAPSLAKLTLLTCLDLSKTAGEMTAEQREQFASALCTAVSNLEHLKHLHLDGCKLDAARACIAKLAPALARLTALRDLSLQGNLLRSSSVIALASHAGAWVCLTKLALQGVDGAASDARTEPIAADAKRELCMSVRPECAVWWEHCRNWLMID